MESADKDPDTRKKLFMAGIKVFAQKGYKEATVRDICKAAGSGNINSINYYFSSKEKLYREILEVIFSDYDSRDSGAWEDKTPREQLKTMITNFCRMLYKGDALASDMTRIFISEMARPSGFTEELVDKYNRPRIERHLKMIRGLLGEEATEDDVRDCLVSVAGQLFYHTFAWPVFSRLFPDCRPDNLYERWADHVYRFSMGGIKAVKTRVKNDKEENDGG